MKADPDRAWDMIREWEAGPDDPATRWIIRHGTRSLRKKN
jgi:3-methyladenine DNA glycosylase AlkC